MRNIFISILLIGIVVNCSAQNLEIFELQKRCSIEANNYVRLKKDFILSPSDKAIENITNHYNKKNGWCLLKIEHTQIGMKDFKSIGIWNVLENKKISSFFSHTHAQTKQYTVGTCSTLKNKQCSSESEFEKDTESLMTE